MTRTLGYALSDLLSTAPLSGVPATQIDDFIRELIADFPFLKRLSERDPQRLERVLTADIDASLSSILPPPCANETSDDAKRRLRFARQDIAFAVAICDLSGLWDVRQVTACLSVFADCAVQIALDAAWTDYLQTFGDSPPTPAGLSILAMGKHGAGELNYSSDIDLVAIYDPDRVPVPDNGRVDARGASVKLVQRMVEILSQQTELGLVFRTDLRLRPNPSATPVAVSLSAAETYYQIYGQNWERAAFIKMRPCAGDTTVSRQFTEMIDAFVWRRALDYGAVADIHAVKKQIHAQKGSPDLVVAGGDVKLGPGGIREVEFFAQTQQLLLGGRDAALRSRRTIDSINALVAAGHVSEGAATKLSAAYEFLRRVEHRLQMREDAQTHTLPKPIDDLSFISRSMGFSSVALFEAAALDHLRFVHDTYAELFATPQPDEPVSGSLVFTGVDDDPRTLQTLIGLGFGKPELVTNAVRQWHRGGLRATKSVRARELLTALVPRILSQVGGQDNADDTFKALDLFLTELPGGFQVFSLFTAEPHILDDVIRLCSAAPDLVRKMGRRPHLVEGLIAGFDTSPVAFMPFAEDAPLEDFLDEARRVVNEHRTRVTAGLVLGQTDPLVAAKHSSELAEQAIEYLLPAVLRANGVDPDSEAAHFAVLAFGRLGARTLTPYSDLDLVFVYHRDKSDADTEQKYTRLIRRVVSALSVPTAEGELYSIDMQLRPSGGSGPAAVTLASFEKYYDEAAWTWEHMALTKARLVFGDGELAARINATIERAMRRSRETQKLIYDVLEMRFRLLTEKPARSPWDVKRRAGGLTDIEFTLQYLALANGVRLGRLPPEPMAALGALIAAGAMARAHGQVLESAFRLQEPLLQHLRATFGLLPPATLSDQVTDNLSNALGVAEAMPLQLQLEQHCSAVIDVMAAVVGSYPAVIDTSAPWRVRPTAPEPL